MQGGVLVGGILVLAPAHADRDGHDERAEDQQHSDHNQHEPGHVHAKDGARRLIWKGNGYDEMSINLIIKWGWPLTLAEVLHGLVGVVPAVVDAIAQQIRIYAEFACGAREVLARMLCKLQIANGQKSQIVNN